MKIHNFRVIANCCKPLSSRGEGRRVFATFTDGSVSASDTVERASRERWEKGQRRSKIYSLQALLFILKIRLESVSMREALS